MNRRLAGRPVSHPADCPVGRSASRSASRSAGRPVSHPADSPVGRSVSCFCQSSCETMILY